MHNCAFSLAWMNRADWAVPTVTGVFSVRGLQILGFNLLHFQKNFLKRSNRLSARDGSSSGWHVSWILNGSAGLAHKFCNRIEGIPSWANCSDQTAMAKYLETEILAKLKSHHSHQGLIPSKIAKKDAPQALFLHPEKFPNILRDVEW